MWVRQSAPTWGPTLPTHRRLIAMNAGPIVRTACQEHELRRVAMLRADAYYENQTFGRYTASLKKQFAEKEYKRIVGSTWIDTSSHAMKDGRPTHDSMPLGTPSRQMDGTINAIMRPGSLQDTINLVVKVPCCDAVDDMHPCEEGEYDVVGTLELGWAAYLLSHHEEGLDHEFMDAHSPLYIRNVVVSEQYRRQGLATLLLEGARTEARAANSDALLVHVDLSNVEAVGLYDAFGFKPRDDFYSSSTKKGSNWRDGNMTAPRLGIEELLVYYI